MPPVGAVWNIDWLNANAQRKYPLFEEASVQDSTGSLKLPNDFLVDFIWPTQSDPTVDPTKFHIAAVSVFGTGVSISIGHDGVIIGAVAIDAATFTRNSDFLIQGTGDFFDTVGRVVIGSLDKILNSAGVFEFTAAAGRFEPTTIRPGLRGVSSLFIQNGDEVSEALQGDIIFEAGSNFSLQFIAGPGAEPDRIQLNAISGEGLNEVCGCNEASELDCIKTINGIAPDVAGNFDLLGDDCLKLSAIANGLQVEDECAKPCCGCDELEVVTSTATDMQNQIFDLENLAAKLEGVILQIQTNLLSSRTGIQQ